MAARKATETLHITPEAKMYLDRFKRTLAARVNADVTYSAAILTAVRDARRKLAEGGKS